MPILKSAKKALRQSVRRRERNSIYKNKVKNLLKQMRSLVNQKKLKEAKNLLPQVYQALDKAAKVGVIKKNAASRNKSRLAKLIEKA